MRMQVTALLLLVLWVAACVSAPPERTQYLLRYDTAPAVPAASPASGKLKVGLGPVSVAAYLTQPGLALETAPNQLHSAQNHLWAEPLAKGLTLYLRAAIAARLGEEVGLQTGSAPGSMQRVDVFVEQLHGTMSGNAVLVASFQIRSGEDAAPQEFRFARSVPLESEGYDALVDAEMQLADQLAAAIAAALR